ncbi:MAG: NAD-dependent epimerase/dehydratase family protein [Infirmifilum sp.]
MRDNVLGTLAVARACLKRGIPLVYMSSAAVYGEPIKLPIGEDHPTRFISPYGLSKLFGKKALELYG